MSTTFGAYQTVAATPVGKTSHEQIVTSKEIGRAISVGIAAMRQQENIETLQKLDSDLRQMGPQGKPVAGSVEALVKNVGAYFDAFEKLNKRRNAIPLDREPPKARFHTEIQPIGNEEKARRAHEVTRYLAEREGVRLKIDREKNYLDAGIERFVDAQMGSSTDDQARAQISETVRAKVDPVVKSFEAGQTPVARREKDQKLARAVQWRMVRENVLYLPTRMVRNRPATRMYTSYPLPQNAPN